MSEPALGWYEATPLASTASSAEKTLNKFLATDLEMSGNIGQDARKSPHLNCIMVGNSDVVLATFFGSQPEMAARLASDLIPEFS